MRALHYVRLGYRESDVWKKSFTGVPCTSNFIALSKAVASIMAHVIVDNVRALYDCNLIAWLTFYIFTWNQQRLNVNCLLHAYTHRYWVVEQASVQRLYIARPARRGRRACHKNSSQSVSELKSNYCIARLPVDIHIIIWHTHRHTQHDTIRQ